MMSEKVSEPIIDQKHLDDLEELRANIIEATGIKYEHEDGILHPVEIINTMQKTLTDDTAIAHGNATPKVCIPLLNNKCLGL
jgi:acetolactate synthase-1/2/3 large subunit